MKSLFIIVGLVFSGVLSAQPTTPEMPPAKTDYLKLSRSQKTAAWIMLGTGPILVVSGAVLIAMWDLGDAGKVAKTGGIIMVGVGSTAMVLSVPLFMAGRKNKKRARSASIQLKLEPVVAMQQLSHVQSSYPAIGISFKLK